MLYDNNMFKLDIESNLNIILFLKIISIKNKLIKCANK